MTQYDALATDVTDQSPLDAEEQYELLSERLRIFRGLATSEYIEALQDRRADLQPQMEALSTDAEPAESPPPTPANATQPDAAAMVAFGKDLHERLTPDGGQ